MLEPRYVSDHGLRGERGPRLLRYLLQRGADEFAITVMALQDTPAPFADAFEDEMAPFARGMAPRRTVTSPPPTSLARPVRLWSLDERSLRHLLSFLDDGLFHCPPGPDGWLEDLTIYRAGELVLGLVSGEREGVLRLTPEEHAEAARLDIPSQPTSDCVAY
ncbi:MAG: hypothetical protein ACYC2G_06635 [Gemmatimonadaceae bacterium]